MTNYEVSITQVFPEWDMIPQGIPLPLPSLLYAHLREAAKKNPPLVVRPIRPYPPPPRAKWLSKLFFVLNSRKRTLNIFGLK